jgi:hypothetical protein
MGVFICQWRSMLPLGNGLSLSNTPLQKEGLSAGLTMCSSNRHRSVKLSKQGNQARP